MVVLVLLEMGKEKRLMLRGQGDGWGWVRPENVMQQSQVALALVGNTYLSRDFAGLHCAILHSII